MRRGKQVRPAYRLDGDHSLGSAALASPKLKGDTEMVGESAGDEQSNAQPSLRPGHRRVLLGEWVERLRYEA